MPSNVVRFEQLMYVAVGLGVVVSALQFSFMSAALGVVQLLVIQAIVFGITILFIWLIARRRAGWARWVFLMLLLSGMFTLIPELIQLIQISPFSGVLKIIQGIVELIALYLVFSGNGAAWFKKTPLPETAKEG